MKFYSIFKFFLDRYCPNPPSPSANGGISNWNAEEMNGTTPYGFKVQFLRGMQLVQYIHVYSIHGST